MILDALVFIQRAAPNRNLVRFRDGILDGFAHSFRGVPVRLGHHGARAGTVIASELVAVADGMAIRQTLELIEPALRGTIDGFSICWRSTRGTVCSICDAYHDTAGYFRLPTCQHDLGQKYDGWICQAEYLDAEGIEVSAVTVPAVVGTGILPDRAVPDANDWRER